MLILTFTGALFINSCGSQKENRITVLAAAGLKEPMTQLVEQYKKEHPKSDLILVLGGSGDLLAMLKNGKGDLYIPASDYYMKRAVGLKLVDPQTVKVVAYHVPVLVVRKDKAGQIKTFKDLINADLRIGLGDSKAAAIGKLSDEILNRTGIYQKVLPKIVVRTPTVNQLLVYLKTGQIDAAIVWKELTPLLGKDFIVIPIGGDFYRKVTAGVTTFSKNRKGALDFENYLIEHRNTFQRAGFSK